MTIKHLREFPTGSPLMGVPYTSGI